MLNWKRNLNREEEGDKRKSVSIQAMINDKPATHNAFKWGFKTCLPSNHLNADEPNHNLPRVPLNVLISDLLHISWWAANVLILLLELPPSWHMSEFDTPSGAATQPRLSRLFAPWGTAGRFWLRTPATNCCTCGSISGVITEGSNVLSRRLCCWKAEEEKKKKKQVQKCPKRFNPPWRQVD